MNQNLKQSMFEYYGERASEYDNIYHGAGPASISDPQAYQAEVSILSEIVKRTCSGNLIDIACGTAFWLPHYAKNCSHVTLFDQSKEMLGTAKKRAVSIGVTDRTTLISGDALTFNFENEKFDSVLVAFLISHFTLEQETHFFKKIRKIVKSGGTILVLDSVWNDERALARKKEGKQKRILADGRAFEIYKKYFDENDFVTMGKTHELNFKIEHFGKVFLAASVINK